MGNSAIGVSTFVSSKEPDACRTVQVGLGDAALTSVEIRHDQTLARHSPRLVHEHVASLVIRVVGDEAACGRGVVWIESFNYLGGLAGELRFGGDLGDMAPTHLGPRSSTHVETLIGQLLREQTHCSNVVRKGQLTT